MKPNPTLHDESRWQAVLDRDAHADGQFVFAVLTTGIFCRPSCRARHALRQNVRFYADASAAQAAGFRPCKRCQPDKADPQQQRIDKVTEACRLLEQERTLTLDELAQAVAVSPYHFHRLFKSVAGMTPRAWQQAWRARKLRETLAASETVTNAVLAAGFPASSSYYRQADSTLGMTARQYRRGGDTQRVRFTLQSCVLGRCLVAASSRGICAVLPGDSDAALIAELAQIFPNAQREEADHAFQQQVAQVIALLDGRRSTLQLPLDIRGTAFQQQVWQALRDIPAGETRSYQQVADSIHKPNAARAVANACAANTLALVIPCHRVVRQSGALSGYRWGEARKAELLKREAKQEP
ncbi:bifunctional DNA-binding transcriptional regulator/O6-methylguanine-DNA methyltransferase Ada [Scandinavium lactucae]|uniref:Bifunctional DNA-binding transcriptional regulator/O6-methylguanine-DNA methyltransferase Ada n=1 Tax=Scandinavium lactucae TaxID=3095028 RepID=A0ABU4QP34_9ENTR|nr:MULTISPECIES: bifunctional DNA-binding transcriptional regulator/O6-methylguanine-DNA methyltransferase Ada [unclassified Scandinavium]MDX6041076.1 bifunctional DNA-binding transcriptional regulator/O6-methylguanine-DNA methyltransferase Ada [Scandinavium sp. V105_6]MDX6050754.1 bifunctional DNA-binding transcriptional regulator/O6-methylguanine-DNA methyltransferase Ada [Scandinavium sp. V105_1]